MKINFGKKISKLNLLASFIMAEVDLYEYDHCYFKYAVR